MSDLHILYTTIFGKLQKGCSELPQEELIQINSTLEQCMEMISSESLFSKNEEIDDVQTESLKVMWNHKNSGQFNPPYNIYIYMIVFSR